ncbi:MAG: LysE family translocator [Thiothrix sp.]|uniref:LysE family translocator n=1 Tax=Thiothrix sp. TaxID=1032 RepID=UPI0026341319|nr:LysE family translocator [Thiothrix sp.]MDD5393231.1 LysE family translocator [Thiothrix sp.]
MTPDPGVFYIVIRSLTQGRRCGLASVAGVALGNLGNAIGASIGLAALFAVSSLAFTLIKYAGAAYLAYLGIQVLRAPSEPLPGSVPEPAKWGRIFRDGFIVALFNPKTTVFFAAFLPQFMEVGAASTQGIMLSILFVVIAGVTDSAYALAAGTVAPLLGQGIGIRRFGRYLSGSAFIGLGIFTAFAGARTTQ